LVNENNSKQAVEDGLISIAGICFYPGGLIYDFGCNALPVDQGTKVVVETAKGQEMGTIIYLKKGKRKDYDDNFKNILRLATPEDLKSRDNYNTKEPVVFKECVQQIKKHNLPMKLIGSHYSYDGSRLTFYFTADHRVDFRQLVRDLATTFGTRIELKQIGPKDEARLLGGEGICGREICCRSFLVRPPSTSTRMAANQELGTKNPDKISGLCGRLRCCLTYEDDVYRDLKKDMPKRGQRVKYENKQGVIVDLRVLKQAILVSFDDDPHKKVELKIDQIKIL